MFTAVKRNVLKPEINIRADKTPISSGRLSVDIEVVTALLEIRDSRATSRSVFAALLAFLACSLFLRVIRSLIYAFPEIPLETSALISHVGTYTPDILEITFLDLNFFGTPSTLLT